MASPDDDVQSWFDQMPDKVQRKMSGPLLDEANKLASAIKQAAPKRTGALAESVQVEQSTDGTFWVVAGGPLTTKYYNKRTARYEREVKIGSDNTAGIAKQDGGEGVSYDYALATEFGTKNENAEPFFYNTVRRVAPELQDAIAGQIGDALND